MVLEAEEISYRARALAQAHPLTAVAKKFLDKVVAEETAAQPLPEIGTWAGAALLTGYCVRRVVEDEQGNAAEAPQGSGAVDGGSHAVVGGSDAEAAGAPGSDPGGSGSEEAEEGALGIEELERSAARIAAELGTDEAIADDRAIAALDRVVASEVSRRLDNWRDSVDAKAWTELEGYVTWWVVRGYALRAAETSTGARS